MEKHRNIFLLGATGSIGSQVLEVIENKNFNYIFYNSINSFDISIF